MVETQLCKLRGTSDTFVGRVCSVPGIFIYKEYGFCALNLRYMIIDTQIAYYYLESLVDEYQVPVKRYSSCR